jgi:hypothetical protein
LLFGRNKQRDTVRYEYNPLKRYTPPKKAVIESKKLDFGSGYLFTDYNGNEVFVDYNGNNITINK